MGKAYFKATMDPHHDGLCRRMAEIGNSVGWTCVLEADADFRGGMAAHHARALRQAEKDFEEASKSGRLGEAEGAARRGIMSAGGVRETRDGKGIRPDLLVREGHGGDKGKGGRAKRLGEDLRQLHIMLADSFGRIHELLAVVRADQRRRLG